MTWHFLLPAVSLTKPKCKVEENVKNSNWNCLKTAIQRQRYRRDCDMISKNIMDHGQFTPKWLTFIASFGMLSFVTIDNAFR